MRRPPLKYGGHGGQTFCAGNHEGGFAFPSSQSRSSNEERRTGNQEWLLIESFRPKMTIRLLPRLGVVIVVVIFLLAIEGLECLKLGRDFEALGAQLADE